MNAASRIFRLFFGVILVFCGLGGIWDNYQFLTMRHVNVPDYAMTLAYSGLVFGFVVSTAGMCLAVAPHSVIPRRKLLRHCLFGVAMLLGLGALAEHFLAFNADRAANRIAIEMTELGVNARLGWGEEWHGGLHTGGTSYSRLYQFIDGSLLLVRFDETGRVEDTFVIPRGYFLVGL
jgi:hypothetical protein